MLETEPITATPVEAAPVKRVRRRIDTSSIFVALLSATAGAGLFYMHWSTAEMQKLVANAGASAASVDTFLSGGKANLASLGKSIRETRGTVSQLIKQPIPASAVADDRDPFVFESSQTKTSTVAAPSSNSAREQAKARLLDSARKLNLQSIMFGSARRSCLISGKLYFEGQPCGEFVVTSIAQDSVYLQGGEFRFELKLRK